MYTGGCRTSLGGATWSALSYNGSQGAEPPRGPRAEPLVGGFTPLKLNAILHYHNMRSGAICSIMFLSKEKKFVRRLGKGPLLQTLFMQSSKMSGFSHQPEKCMDKSSYPPLSDAYAAEISTKVVLKSYKTPSALVGAGNIELVNTAFCFIVPS